MNIDITDYLSHDEIKDICASELRISIAKDAERILSNLSYQAAFGIVDSTIDKEQIEKVRSAASRVINEITAFHVFRRKDVWDKSESVAYTELQKAMQENAELIHEKVRAAIEEKDYSTDIELNQDTIAYTIINALRIGLSTNGGK